MKLMESSYHSGDQTVFMTAHNGSVPGSPGPPGISPKVTIKVSSIKEHTAGIIMHLDFLEKYNVHVAGLEDKPLLN